MQFSGLAQQLASALSAPVQQNVDLRAHCWWRVGGTGRLLVEPRTANEVVTCLRILSGSDVPRLVIGDGSNLLFDDDGFSGVLVRIGRRLSGLRIDGLHVRAEAGHWVPRLVRDLGRHGLSGLEHAIGIPGTLGGLVMMNGGSQRKGVGSQVTAVRGCDLSGNPFEKPHSECRFRYRGSTLQDDGLIVLEADFEMASGDPATMRREMVAILADRRRKFPKSLPNCGSVFLSDPAMYATVGPPGAAIERVGLKGLRSGDAQISPLHANFIVNLGQARSVDILTLIRRARLDVHRATGFWMDCEVRYVSPDGRVVPAHVAADEKFS